jgi:hypothetical protein
LLLLLLLLPNRLLQIVLEFPSLSDAAFQDSLPDIISWLHGQRKSCSPQQARLKSCYSRLLFLLSRCSQIVSNGSGGQERPYAGVREGLTTAAAGAYTLDSVATKLQQLLHSRPRSSCASSRHSIDVGAAAAAGDGPHGASAAANAAVELLLRRQQQQAEQQEHWQGRGSGSSSRRPSGSARNRRKSAFGELAACRDLRCNAF